MAEEVGVGGGEEQVKALEAGKGIGLGGGKEQEETWWEKNEDMELIDKEYPEIYDIQAYSWLERAQKFLHYLVMRLLVSTHQLEEISFALLPQYYSFKTIMFFGVAKRAFYLALLAYFLYGAYYKKHVTEFFMSLNPLAGECLAIPKASTGVFEVDLSGHWKGTNVYQSNMGTYKFEMYDFLKDQNGYEAWMKVAVATIQAVGEGAKKRDLGINLIYWCSWFNLFETIGTGGSIVSQKIYFDANPSYVMWKNIFGTIANVNIDCPVDVSTLKYSKTMSTSYQYFTYSTFRKSRCANVLNPFVLGYNPNTMGDKFSVTIDVNALFSVLAVSLKLGGPNTLNIFVTTSHITEGIFDANDGNGPVLYEVIDKYDPGYPGMKPFTCVGPKGGDVSSYNCAIRVGQSYGAPFLVSAGANDTSPVYCDCSDGGPGYSDKCDNFDLLYGILVWDYTNPDLSDHLPTHVMKNTTDVYWPRLFRPMLPLMELFYVPPVVPMSEVSKLAFKPAWQAIFQSNNAIIKSQAWRNSSYNFCLTVSFGYCSIVVFRQYSLIGDRSINDNNRQLPFASCEDSFYSKNLTNVIKVPWGDLIEHYYSCLEPAQSAFFSSLGIATGSASSISPFSIIAFLYTCMTISALNLCHKDTYRKAKDELTLSKERLAQMQEQLEREANEEERLVLERIKQEQAAKKAKKIKQQMAALDEALPQSITTKLKAEKNDKTEQGKEVRDGGALPPPLPPRKKKGGGTPAPPPPEEDNVE